jgi:hypothetical protein
MASNSSQNPLAKNNSNIVRGGGKSTRTETGYDNKGANSKLAKTGGSSKQIDMKAKSTGSNIRRRG